MRRPVWTMPADEARTLLERLQEKIASSEIEVKHKDVLIRLRSMIEEDLASTTEAMDERRQAEGGRATDPSRERGRLAGPERNRRSELSISCRPHTRSGMGSTVATSQGRSGGRTTHLTVFGLTVNLTDRYAPPSASATTLRPHRRIHLVRKLLLRDPFQVRLPTSERFLELLRGYRAKGDDAPHATVLAQPAVEGDAAPPSALPPLMVDEVACGDADRLLSVERAYQLGIAENIVRIYADILNEPLPAEIARLVSHLDPGQKASEPARKVRDNPNP
jgi:hypothetical protein